MGRRRTKIDRNEKGNNVIKNVLAQVFGHYLKKERAKLEYAKSSAASISSMLNVSDSYYRLIESGSANFNPVKAIDLINIFTSIQWEPLVKLLIACQVLDDHMQLVKKTRAPSWNDFKNGIQIIAEKDQKLNTLLQRFEPIWQYDPLNEVDKEKIETILFSEKTYLETEKFLTTRSYGVIEKSEIYQLDSYLDNLGPDQIRRELQDYRVNYCYHDEDDFDFASSINEASSIYLEVVANSLRSLNNINPNLFSVDSSKWELSNQHNFRELYGYLGDFDRILNKENLQKFDYAFLWNEGFQGLYYLVANNNSASNQFKLQFISELEKRYNEEPHKYQYELKNAEIGFSKIHISVYEDHMIKEYFNEKHIKWVYTLINGNKVGFELEAGANISPYSSVLSYKEAKELLYMLKDIWGRNEKTQV